MSSDSQPRPISARRGAGSRSAPPGSSRSQRERWSWLTPTVFALCGVLFYISAADSGGEDLRPGRYTDLASLVSDQNDEAERLTSEVNTLRREVAELGSQIDDSEAGELREQSALLMEPAGLTTVTGTAVTVTLSDAPIDVINQAPPDRVNDLIIHQQDIQAVVNTMWKGGAAAVTVQGERIVTTSGIKCLGGVVLLNGVQYPEPYVITAVGEQGELLQALEFDPYLQAIREAASEPETQIGYELSSQAVFTAPAYDGLLDLTYAEPTGDLTEVNP